MDLPKKETKMARNTNLLPSIFRDFSMPNLWQEFEDWNNFGKDQGLSVYDQNNEIIVEAAMPGLTADDIQINLDKGVLWIKGEKKEEESDKDKKFYRKAIRSFSYNVALPDQTEDKQEPEASYKDGVLKISFKKAKSAEAKKITIKK